MKVFSKRLWSLLLGLTVLSMVFAACGSATDTGSSGSGGGTGNTANTNGKNCKQVGILLPESASSDRWESKDRPLLTQSIQAVLPSGGTVDYSNAQGSSDTQLTQAQADLTKGACILVVGAHDSDQAASIVAAAKAKNVPVIAYDRLIQSKDLNYYVSFDNVRVGELQGQFIKEHYKKGEKVVMINGSDTDNNAKLFYKGVISVLQPLFNSGELVKVYDKFTPDWNNTTAQTEMDAALTANNNNIQIAYVANDGMANSVIASLKAKNLNGKVLVTGQDATVAGIQNILLGDQSMTVYKAISKEAQATADLVKALINGTDTAALTKGNTTATSDGGNIPSVLETPVSVDKSNVASTVIADGFVSKEQVCANVPAGTNTGGVCG